MVAVEARKPGVALESAAGTPRYSEVSRKRVPEARPLEVPPVLLVMVAAWVEVVREG